MTKTKIIDTCKDFITTFANEIEFLKRGFIKQEEKNEINGLVTKCTTLLITMLEANKDETVINTLAT